MSRLKGLGDGPGGRNENFNVGTRKRVPLKTIVKEIEAGKHKGTHIYKLNKKKYARDNPDRSELDNVNGKK